MDSHARPEFTSLLALLQHRAAPGAPTADAPAFTFLEDGEQVSGVLTFAGLDRRARALAAQLQQVAAPGDRVLLVYPPGLEYIAAFFACVYAGMVAVPALPPANAKTLPRLQLIARDAQPSVALTLGAIAERMAQWHTGDEQDTLATLRWLASDTLPDAPGLWRAPQLDGSEIAFLQYTSGSTGNPKGVMVSHANILANARLIGATVGAGPGLTVVSWLPPHHDMGLIGKILYPVYAGCHSVQFPPAAFLLRPHRWLKLMSQFRAHATAAPNFAYELCANKITEEHKRGLDLSALRFALNGSEPIRQDTLRRFGAAFADCGLRPDALTPVYGLAESTLLVTANLDKDGRQHEPVRVSRRALEAHSVREADGAHDTIELVSSGAPTEDDHHIAIADPVTLERCADGGVGEIWVHGQSVAKGYWNREAESVACFDARLAGEALGYLRTGDLGFVRDGRLYVTGRIKEMMIVNGRNVYPQDVEATVERLDPAFRASGCAVFSVQDGARTQLVVVQELESRKQPVLEGLAERLRAELAEQHQVLDVAALVLVKAGHVPRTSSGKIQRLRCRELYRNGSLAPVWSWPQAGAASDAGTPDADADSAPRSATEQTLAAIWQQLFDVDTVSVHADFLTLGGHSLLATQAVAQVRDVFGIDLPLRALFEAPTIATLAVRIEAERAQAGDDLAPAIAQAIAPAAHALPQPLSFSQQRLWFLQQLEPDSDAYHIAAAVRLSGRLDASALALALNDVVERHDALRTTFVELASGPAQRIGAMRTIDLPLVDLGAVPAHEREPHARALARSEAHARFDLGAGPLLRARLLRLDEREHILVLTLHHIVADGWSMGVLARALSGAYRARVAGEAPAPAPLPFQYADFAQWQREWLTGAVRERQLGYWRAQLGDAPAVLTLPTDRPRVQLQGYRGAKVGFALPAATLAGLRALGQRSGATPFMTLYAAFTVLLARYSGQDDVCVGTFIAGRTRADTQGLIGCFINTLVLRTRLDPDQSFAALLAQVRSTTLDAYANQDLPFEQVLEAVNPERHAGHAPLFQAMLNLYPAPLSALDLPALDARQVELDEINTRAELALHLVEDAGRIDAALEYNAELFEASTIERMAEHFARLLEAIAADAATPVALLPLLGQAERARQLVDWNRSEHTFPLDLTYAALFARQAAATPERTAAVCAGQALSYRELDQRAGRIARALREAGAGTDTVVVLLAERGLPLLAMMVGVLKAGAAFLPLEANHPPERLGRILATSRAPLVLASTGCADLLGTLLDGMAETVPTGAPRALIAQSLWLDGAPLALEPAGSPDDLAYVISTSGSTGTPKQAMVEQRGMLNNMFGKVPTLGFCGADRLAQTASPAFDISIWQFLAAPLVGATVHILPDAIVHDPRRLIEAVETDGLTLLEIVPSMMRGLLDLCPDATTLASLRWVLPTGEALPLKLAQDWCARFPAVPLMNVYGPAECSDDVAYHAIRSAPGAGAAIPIGRPTPNNRLYILDRRLQPVPVGVAGEICVAGTGVGRGYLNDPAQTQHVFVEHPFGQGRLYRTGDIGRYRADGVIDYLGRIDHQVKVRGFRIELGEIETRLAAQPQVRDVAVIVREDSPGDKRLVAYLVAHDGAEVTDAAVPELRAALLRSLPDYMVPAHFVFIERLPLTPNGKLDRRALPAPDTTRSEAGYVAPRNEVETVLAEIWAGVLKLDKVGVTDNFFLLGGHSLLATQVISQLRAGFALELPLRTLFEAPTVEQLAARVDRARQQGEQSTLPAIVPVERGGALALSFAQQRLWFLDQFESGSAFYNIPAAVRLAGQLDVAALGRTVNEVVARHEALRTTFATRDGTPVQLISPHLTLELPLVDLSELPPAEREARAQWLAQDEAQTPFDLGTGPLIRVRLLRLQENEHIALFTVHHIVSDGWSMGVLVREVAALYGAFVQNLASPLSPLAVQYADFAHWQRAWLAGDTLEGQLAYWREQLGGAPALLALPTDRPRPAVQSFRGAMHAFVIPAATTAGLHKVAAQAEATLFMTLAAVFNILLARYVGQSDISIGTPIANRNRAETEALIGFFVNTLVLRTQVERDITFAELLRQVRANALGAYAHQDVPFEQLVDALKPERHLSHSPLFQVMLALQNAPMGALALPGLNLQLVEPETATAKFDLTAIVTEVDGELHAGFEYNTDLFDASTIARMVRHFTTLLDAVVAQPNARVDQLAMLADAEREQLLLGWNATTRAYPQRETLHQLFEARAARMPDSVAVSHLDASLRYGELNARANRLAHYLRAHGVGPDSLVGICVERSFDMVVGLLAIVKAGGAYLPLDPGYPQERLAHMLDDARPVVLLTQQHLRDVLPPNGLPTLCMDSEPDALASLASDNLANATLPDNLAYVIYTSGSTGKPKGVSISHQAVKRLVYDTEYLPLGENERIGQAASSSFDALTFELWTALLHGAQLVIIPKEVVLSPHALADEIRTRGVTALFLTTAVFNQVAAHCPDAFVSLRHLLFGGEAVDPRAVATVLREGAPARLLHVYGPTESTTFALWHRVGRVDVGALTVPLGRPITNTQVYIVDDELNPVPVGVAGHLYIAGDGLARDYLNRPELTAERFIPNPFATVPGARMYQSGDLARYLPDGAIEYLGRGDDQVKIRGLRIELGEIQARLAALAQVREAAVIVREDSPGDKRLVAYLVPHGADADVDAESLIPELRAALLQALPDYMVPAHFVFLDVLPLTPNGKIDRRVLPLPDTRRGEAGHVAPRTDTEVALCAIWAEVLKLDQVGVTDNFFLLGGHSLLATQMSSHIRTRFDIALPLRALFESTTVAALAIQVDRAVSEAAQAKAAQKTALNAKVQNTLANMSDEEIIALALEKRRQKAAQQLKDIEHE